MPRKMMPKGMKPFKDIMMRIKFVLTEPRWTILKIIGDGEKATNEIYSELQNRGILIPKSTLYYHLSNLEDSGIIELAGYREEGGGAPEKVWRLKVKRIGIDILSGKIVIE